ncbi:MAG: hypothetical protein GX273_09410 [Bacteroidales bacterium]|nr:hypothetical protein [Bacteroidales bacterium]
MNKGNRKKKYRRKPLTFEEKLKKFMKISDKKQKEILNRNKKKKNRKVKRKGSKDDGN